MHRFATIGLLTLLAGSISACASEPAQPDDEPTLSATDDSERDADELEARSTGLRWPWWWPRRPETKKCTLPPDCEPIANGFLNYGACCTEKVACGIDLTAAKKLLGDPWIPKELKEAFVPPGVDLTDPCVDPAKLYGPSPDAAEERFKGDDGDILVTPTCKSRNLTLFRLPGCCLPSGQCGLSTQSFGLEIQDLAKEGQTPGIRTCATSELLYSEIKKTTISLLAAEIEIPGTCDYAGLNARLPPAKPDPWDLPVDETTP